VKKEPKMATLQKRLAEIRELQAEELDLVGGAGTLSGEATAADTQCSVTYTANGHTQTVSVSDDKTPDFGADWD
jgi:hypothetical protein